MPFGTPIDKRGMRKLSVEKKSTCLQLLTDLQLWDQQSQQCEDFI